MGRSASPHDHFMSQPNCFDSCHMRMWSTSPPKKKTRVQLRSLRLDKVPRKLKTDQHQYLVSTSSVLGMWSCRALGSMPLVEVPFHLIWVSFYTSNSQSSIKTSKGQYMHASYIIKYEVTLMFFVLLFTKLQVSFCRKHLTWNG